MDGESPNTRKLIGESKTQKSSPNCLITYGVFTVYAPDVFSYSISSSSVLSLCLYVWINMTQY